MNISLEFRRIRDDRGQATIEYILMLSIAVTLALIVVKTIIGPALSKLSENISKGLTNQLFNPRTMHQIRIPR